MATVANRAATFYPVFVLRQGFPPPGNQDQKDADAVKNYLKDRYPPKNEAAPINVFSVWMGNIPDIQTPAYRKNLVDALKQILRDGGNLVCPTTVGIMDGERVVGTRPATVRLNFKRAFKALFISDKPFLPLIGQALVELEPKQRPDETIIVSENNNDGRPIERLLAEPIEVARIVHDHEIRGTNKVEGSCTLNQIQNLCEHALNLHKRR